MGQPQQPVQPSTTVVPDPASSKMALAAKTASNTPSQNVLKLMEVGKSLVTNQAWYPKGATTFCNYAVASGAKQFGFLKLYDNKGNPLMANEIVKVLDTDPNWLKATATDAWDAALQGKLAVATYVEAPHGHVAVLSPGARVWSVKWSAYVPQVYNVGKADGMNLKAPYSVGENFAFLYRPVHYVYAPRLSKV